jgi:hypothetical protein
VLGYADDITILTNNTNECVNEAFHEYQRLTQASGLCLNADKTEKFNITGVARTGALKDNYVMYNSQCYQISAQTNVKINGIYFDQNINRMATLNYDHMKGKMCRHFSEWSKRSLSLLGKIQIMKTFGLSQYLYSLAVTDLSAKQWVEVQKLLYKFLWNKDFHARAAPHRIRKSIVTTPKLLGGLGMVELRDVVMASRLKRFAVLKAQKTHPVEGLQEVLGGYEYLRPTPKMDIDVVTTTVMATLLTNINTQQLHMRPGLAEADLVLHRQLLHCRLRWVVRSDRLRSIEYNLLRSRGRRKVIDLIRDNNEVTMLQRILAPPVGQAIAMLNTEYQQMPLPDADDTIRVYNADSATWLLPSLVSSSTVRLFLDRKQCITNFKLLNMEEDAALRLLSKLNKIISVQNKTKMLRLLHGDVYCGARLLKFGLSDNDLCNRCFSPGTVVHMLLECPYTTLVWSLLQVETADILNILDSEASLSELEVRAEIINHLVFRRSIIPPDILVKTIIKSYTDKLCRRRATTNLASTIQTWLG